MREATTASDGPDLVADAERNYTARTPGSRRRWARAAQVQPNGVSGNGKFFPPHPLFIGDAHGSRVTDVDGQEYVDVLMGSGSLLLGHGHPRVIAAVSEQVARFSGTTMPHEPGLALAERMSAKRGLPRIRFTVTGSEATQSALRVARSATGQRRFAKCEGGYHGSGDGFLVATHSTAMAGSDTEPAATPDYAGLPPSTADDVVVLPYNDVAAAERLIGEYAADLAAVIVEPVLFSSGGAVPATREFLDTLRKETRARGIVLIFDEVVTGYRLGPRGAESHYGIIADLVTLGKGVAAGLPLAAYGGRVDLMDHALAGGAENRVFQSGTYVENAVSVAAAHAVLDELAERPDVLARLDALGERLRTGIAAELDRAGVPGVVTGTGSLLHFHLGATSVTNRRELLRADVELTRLTQLALVAAGVLWQPLHPAALSTVHTEQDVEDVLTIMREVLR